MCYLFRRGLWGLAEDEDGCLVSICENKATLQNKCLSTSLLVLSSLFLKTNFIPSQTTTCQCRALMFVALLSFPVVFRIRIALSADLDLDLDLDPDPGS